MYLPLMLATLVFVKPKTELGEVAEQARKLHPKGLLRSARLCKNRGWGLSPMVIFINKNNPPPTPTSRHLNRETAKT
jgi:hypothetical protein